MSAGTAVARDHGQDTRTLDDDGCIVDNGRAVDTLALPEWRISEACFSACLIECVSPSGGGAAGRAFVPRRTAMRTAQCIECLYQASGINVRYAQGRQDRQPASIGRSMLGCKDQGALCDAGRPQIPVVAAAAASVGI